MKETEKSGKGKKGGKKGERNVTEAEYLEFIDNEKFTKGRREATEEGFL